MTHPAPGVLQRLRHNGEQTAWERFVDLYTPLLYFWAIRAGLPGAEAADLVREVCASVARRLSEFVPAPGAGFRSWLRGLAHAARRELLLKRPVPVGPAGQSAEPAAVPAGAEVLWEAEYAPTLLGRASELLQGEFPAAEWQAFWALTAEGRPATDVARELNLPVPAVYAAEARVLRRLRQELDGLLD
jgi:RNA polymerase sigma-70 factor (ECF subfamily)